MGVRTEEREKEIKSKMSSNHTILCNNHFISFIRCIHSCIRAVIHFGITFLILDHWFIGSSFYVLNIITKQSEAEESETDDSKDYFVFWYI